MRALRFFGLAKLHGLFWFGLALLFFGLFVKISWELHEDSGIGTLDRQILVFISSYRNPAFNGPAVDLTALGSPTVLTLFAVLGVFVLILGRDLRGSAYLAVGSIGAGLGTFLIKHTFSRARPTVVPPLIEVSGFSYPSGHSLGATSFYLLVMFLIWRHLGSWPVRIGTLASTALLIVGVCLSRLYLGVHYPSDVLSGMLIGAAWVCLLTPCFFDSDHHLI